MKIDDYVKLYIKIYDSLICEELKPVAAKDHIAMDILKEKAKDVRARKINEMQSETREKSPEPEDLGEQRGEATDWRDDPATEKQKGMLDQLSIVYQSDITKGEASDKIEEKIGEEE